MILLLFFAFLSGLATILAPCIWPLLPIVLSAASGGKSHTRPLGVTLGIMFSFTVFTLAISYLVKLLHLDANLVRLLAVAVLVFMGVMMLVPRLAQVVEVWVSRLSGKMGVHRQSSDFGGGFVTGLSLGVVWTPCSGPILASIATLAATGQVTLSVILVTLAYVVGVGIPLFLFAYGGQRLFQKTRVLSSRTGLIQQIFGVIMLLTALAIYTNYDKYLELQLLTAFPSVGQSLTAFESSQSVQDQLLLLKKQSDSRPSLRLTPDLLPVEYPAPEITGITKWLNSPPLTLSRLKGKVVLLDFWTYTCINCIRTLPHVTAWYEKYKEQGLVVIGIHTPEFEFEKSTPNVQQALKQYAIHYPVAQDNDYATWNAFSNQYWPAEYLIDAQGHVRRTHFGEGEYEQSEQAIQQLLKEAGKSVTQQTDSMPDETPHSQLSPETYVGAKRMQYYYPSGNTGVGKKTFVGTQTVPQDTFSFGGTWDIQEEDAVSGKQATLVYHFTGDKVYLVMHPATSAPGKVTVLLDGKPVPSELAGSDVQDGVLTVDQPRLYSLINLHGKSGEHVVELRFQTEGVEAFAFTFG